MFGKLLGEIAAAPLRVASTAAKVTQIAVDELTECTQQPKPGRNCADRLADKVSETIEDTLDD